MIPTFGTEDDAPPATLAERIDDALIRLDEYRRHPRTVAAAVLVALCALGAGWWVARPPPARSVEDLIPNVSLTPTSFLAQSTEPLVVHVVGEVASPGVFTLPAGSRILDAVAAAGGATDQADLQRINLAAGLSDGVQIRLPKTGENTESLPLIVGGQSSGATGGVGGVGLNSAKVNINLASPAELEVLVGVGPALATAIVAHREKNGPFASAEGLLDVRGIGPAKLEAMVDQMVVR